jgi:hypothetical protein
MNLGRLQKMNFAVRHPPEKICSKIVALCVRLCRTSNHNLSQRLPEFTTQFGQSAGLRPLLFEFVSGLPSKDCRNVIFKSLCAIFSFSGLVVKNSDIAEAP